MTFTGTVTESCSINGLSTTPVLTRTSDDTLAGSTGAFTVTANTDVDLQLTNLTVTQAPSGTSGYTWSSSLNADATTIGTATIGNDSTAVTYQLGDLDGVSFSIDASVISPDVLIPGTYTAAISLDCVATP